MKGTTCSVKLRSIIYLLLCYCRHSCSTSMPHSVLVSSVYALDLSSSSCTVMKASGCRKWFCHWRVRFLEVYRQSSWVERSCETISVGRIRGGTQRTSTIVPNAVVVCMSEHLIIWTCVSLAIDAFFNPKGRWNSQYCQLDFYHQLVFIALLLFFSCR